MDVVYFGSGALGIPTLEAISRRHRVVLVVTQPDRPAGRGGKLTPTPVAEWAASNLAGVPILKPEKVNEAGVVDQIRAAGGSSSAWVVIAFGQKLGKSLLADRFAVNLHGSILPRWRGAAPINAAILAGDDRVGVTAITLADRMDAGLILGVAERQSVPDWTAEDLHEVLSNDGPALMLDVLERHAAGTLEGRPQNETAVTLAPKMRKEDGWIDFSASAEECRRRVHGLWPWPAVTVRFRGEPMKLVRVKVEDGPAPGAPGTLSDGLAGLVACGSGVLRLLEVVPAGKRRMSWFDFANGHRVERGERFEGGGGSTTLPA